MILKRKCLKNLKKEKEREINSLLFYSLKVNLEIFLAPAA